MFQGLGLRIRHSGTTQHSVFITDIERYASGKVQFGAYATPDPNGGLGPPLDLVFTNSVARSYETGSIRGHITSGKITAEIVLGVGFPSTPLVYWIPLLVSANQTVVEKIWMPKAGTLVKAEALITTPATTAGDYTLDIQQNASSLLSSAFDLTQLAADTPTEIPLATAVELPVGRVVSVQATSNNPDLTGAGLYLQLTFE
jgi:hypothetical protein